MNLMTLQSNTCSGFSSASVKRFLSSLSASALMFETGSDDTANGGLELCFYPSVTSVRHLRVSVPASSSRPANCTTDQKTCALLKPHSRLHIQELSCTRNNLLYLDISTLLYVIIQFIVYSFVFYEFV